MPGILTRFTRLRRPTSLHKCDLTVLLECLLLLPPLISSRLNLDLPFQQLLVNVLQTCESLAQEVFVQLPQVSQLHQKKGSHCSSKLFRKANEPSVAPLGYLFDQLPELGDPILSQKLSQLIVLDVFADKGSSPRHHAHRHLGKGEGGLSLLVLGVTPTDDQKVVIAFNQHVFEAEVVVSDSGLLCYKQNCLAHLPEVEATDSF